MFTLYNYINVNKPYKEITRQSSCACKEVGGVVMSTSQPNSYQMVLRQCSDVLELQYQAMLKLQEEKVLLYRVDCSSPGRAASS